MAEPKKNAIAERFDRLADQWNVFAQDGQAKLLRWLVRDDEIKTAEAFCSGQKEGAFGIPDLFMVLESPFRDIAAYTPALLDEFAAQVEAARPAFAEAGLPDTWAMPTAGLDPHQPSTLLRACAGFRQFCDGLAENLAVILIPEALDKPDQWQRWLYEILKAGVPAGVRFAVLDRRAQPALAELARAAGGLVKSVEADLDMPGAILALASENLHQGPGAIFRKRLMELANLLDSGDLGAIKAQAQAALAIARKEAWHDQQCVVWTMLAGACHGAGQGGEAIRCYQAVVQAAEQAVAQKHPAGYKLMANGFVGEAGVHLVEQRPEEAARVYQRAAQAAEQADDAFLAMECWRMTAQCWHDAGQADPAWRCAWAALKPAETVAPDLLPKTTFPYLAKLLGQLVRRQEYAQHLNLLRTRMTTLAGAEFAAQVAGGNAS